MGNEEMKDSLEASRQVLETVVRSVITSVDVLSVGVHEDTDEEGIPILRVRVAIKRNGKQLDSGQTLGLRRKASQALGNIRETRFPLFRFVEK